MHSRDAYYVDGVEKANVIYVRPVAERLTDEEREDIQRLLGGQGITAINHVDGFLDHDCKDRTFEIWKKNGLRCPEWTEYREPTNKHLNIPWPQAYLRTNNMSQSKFMMFVKRNDEYGPDKLRQMRQILYAADASRRSGRSHSKVIYVQFLGSETGRHLQCRSFVVGDRIINSYAMGSVVEHGYIMPGDFHEFFEQNRLLNKYVNDPQNQSDIIRACSSVGCDVGAVDYLIIDGRVWFLEVNALWGMGWSRLALNREWSERLDSNLDGRMRAKLPQLYQRMDLQWFWKQFYDALMSLCRKKLSQ